MDQITQQSTTKNCIKHSQKKIKFVQVNDVSNSQENNHLFYCTTCINKDLTFKGINYLLISQIINEGESNIIQKWPPVNDYSILERLIQHTQEKSSSKQVIHQINIYFTQLKEEFLRKVDLCEKKMIINALNLPLGNENIIKQYQDISQINKLRSLLIDGIKKENETFQPNYQQFLTEIESKKGQNSELLSNLLQQCEQKQELVNFDYPNLIKDSIFTFIDQIDFFNNQHLNNNSSLPKNEITKGLNASKIMKLISNRSNFCSEDFLSQLEQLFERINPLLSSIQFDNMHELNKTPLDFSALSQQRFDLLKDLIDHQTQIERNKEFAESIKTTKEYQQLEQILESNINFVNSSLKEQLKQYLMESYPLLKQVNFTNTSTDKDKFDTFRSLTDIEIEDLIYLIKKRKIFAEDNQYNSSFTKQIQDRTQHALRDFEDVDKILRKYPIFDLMKKIEIKKQPFEIKLTKTNFQNGNNIMDIQSDKELSLNQINFNYLNCISNKTLEKDKRYIFRFSVQNCIKQSIRIGLMQNTRCDSYPGYDCNLSCFLKGENGVIKYKGGSGIDKHLKGDRLMLSNENEIEMRVWQGNKQLEILDFPNYRYKVELKDEYKSKLLDCNDLNLYIGIYQIGFKVVLVSAIEVNYFPN